MKYIDMQGNRMIEESGQDKLLRYLYTCPMGRMLLKVLVRPGISKAGGRLLARPWSRVLVGPFIKKHKIDLSLYKKQEFSSYNDFFTRQIKSEYRPFQGGENILSSPCDGKLSVYPIRQNSHFFIKHTDYSLESLLRSKTLAKRYQGGYACVFRLTVDDYHRYCYVDSGIKSKNYRIPGIFHTVNPVANDAYPIYRENTREFSLFQSQHFQTILMMEVGALLVGQITNYHGEGPAERGQEKGRFEFGGSTVILLFQKGAVQIEEKLLEHTLQGYETIVKMGERIGRSYVEKARKM